MVLAQQSTASGSAVSARPAAQLSAYPVAVSISGPSAVFYNDPATWTAFASYGTAPYTYTWYRNGVQVGTGSTYSVVVTGSFTLAVTVRDASGASASASKSVTVQYECRHC